MRHRVRQIIPILLALVAVGLSARAVQAEDEKAPWDQTFNGHEMWSMNIDSALALSKAADKPLLVDFYQLG